MEKFSAYKLPLKSLGVGAHTFEYHLDKSFFEDMESADIQDADLDVRLAVKYDGECYDFTFTFSGRITLVCDRCLDDLVYPIETTYHIAVKYGESYNDDNDDMLVIPESDNNFNVAYMMYDTVELEIPIKHVHADGECNSQMSEILKSHQVDFVDDDSADDTEETAAVDPRWSALKKISSMKDETEE